jgi:hypothetical protein
MSRALKPARGDGNGCVNPERDFRWQYRDSVDDSAGYSCGLDESNRHAPLNLIFRKTYLGDPFIYVIRGAGFSIWFAAVWLCCVWAC